MEGWGAEVEGRGALVEGGGKTVPFVIPLLVGATVPSVGGSSTCSVTAADSEERTPSLPAGLEPPRFILQNKLTVIYIYVFIYYISLSSNTELRVIEIIISFTQVYPPILN